MPVSAPAVAFPVEGSMLTGAGGNTAMALSLQSGHTHVLVPDGLVQALSVLLGFDPYRSLWRAEPREIPSLQEAVKAERQRVHKAHVDAVGGTEPWRAGWLASRLHDDDWYVLLLEVEVLLGDSAELIVLGD